jgi:hypothetical protein
MSVHHQTRTPHTETFSEAHLPKDDLRQSYLFERRVTAMEQRIRESGLPNQFFPFIAAQCVATPEWNTLREVPNFYDAVSVLKGIRPVALLTGSDMRRDLPFSKYILHAIALKGLTVYDDPRLPNYIVGEPSRVESVLRVIQRRMETGGYSEQYHRELGEALAYPTAAVERFLKAIARGQSPLEASMIEAAIPLRDDSSLTLRLPNGRIAAIC